MVSVSDEEVKDFTLSQGEVRNVTAALRAYEESDDDRADEAVVRSVRERLESAFEQLSLE